MSPATTYSLARFTTSAYASRSMLRRTCIGARTGSERGCAGRGPRSFATTASIAASASR